jgi:hypothetical protein
MYRSKDIRVRDEIFVFASDHSAVGDEAVLDMILSFKQTYEARGAA